LTFKYVAENSSKVKQKGSIDADNRIEAIQLLVKQGLFPLSVTDVQQAIADKNESFLTRDIQLVDIHKRKVNKKKLLTFSNQMAIMIRAGVPLTTAMDILTLEESDRSLKKILEAVRMDLHLGVRLSSAMRKFKTFPDIMLSMIEAGETDGRLDTAFDRIAKTMTKELQLASKVRGASGYPIFLLVLTTTMVIFISLFVLPSFVSIFQNFDAELPLITRMLIGFSNFMVHRWYTIPIAVALIVLIWTLLKKYSEGFRIGLGKLKINLPVLGKLLKRIYASRFCEVLSSMSLAGIDITEGFRVTANTIKNPFVKKQLMMIMDDIRVGSTISAAMDKNNPFDRLLLSMVRTGEESGMLPETLGKMAELYEDQTNDSIKLITSLMEPMMTIVIAVIVGTVVIGMVTPMFGIYSLIGNS